MGVLATVVVDEDSVSDGEVEPHPADTTIAAPSSNPATIRDGLGLRDLVCEGGGLSVRIIRRDSDPERIAMALSVT